MQGKFIIKKSTHSILVGLRKSNQNCLHKCWQNFHRNSTSVPYKTTDESKTCLGTGWWWCDVRFSLGLPSRPRTSSFQKWPLHASTDSLTGTRGRGLPTIHMGGIWWKEIGASLEFIIIICWRVWRTLIKEAFSWWMRNNSVLLIYPVRQLCSVLWSMQYIL